MSYSYKTAVIQTVGQRLKHSQQGQFAYFRYSLSYELKKLTEKNTLCKKHSATDMWWVTSKAQNGEIRIVPILEILRTPIGTAVGQDSRYNIRYSQEPVKAIGFKALMKKYK